MKVSEHALKMDNIYRYQKYIYDVTRKYYLFGRDKLLTSMPVDEKSHVLEVGCGTGRNLFCLYNKVPGISLYGIDASMEMLDVALTKIEKNKLPIDLKCMLAEEVSYKDFDLQQPFDVIFFSYSLSMIPTWEQSLENAFSNLKHGGVIYIVDFWNQEKWPRWFQGMLKKWLALFHVKHEPLLLHHIQNNLDKHLAFSAKIDSVLGQYSYIAELTKK